MSPEPYERFQADELILRDELAIDRTILANERTLLSYYRMTLTLVIAGVTFVQFPDRPALLIAGILCFPLGSVVASYGWIRFSRMKGSIEKARKPR